MYFFLKRNLQFTCRCIVKLNADYVSESKPMVDDYLEVYEGLCDAIKVHHVHIILLHT